MQKFQSVGFPVMTSHQSASHGQWAVIVIRFYFVCATLAPDDRKLSESKTVHALTMRLVMCLCDSLATHGNECWQTFTFGKSVPLVLPKEKENAAAWIEQELFLP